MADKKITIEVSESASEASTKTKASTKSATSAKSAARSTAQKESSKAQAPKTAARTLRQKVLTRQASRRSSISEELSDQIPPPLPETTPPHSPMDISTQKVDFWELSGSKPELSADELSDGSSASEQSSCRRKSMLCYSSRGMGVEMDVATKAANEMLLKAKDALEAAGNMKKECKIIALECLQSLYETVLSLSDSRQRHKYNLEKERARHAQELVRAERAHTKTLTETLKDLGERLGEARTDITGNLEETRAIRSWLGYETTEPYSQIKTIKETVSRLETSIWQVSSHMNQTAPTSPATEDLSRIEAKLGSLANQLDGLRKDLEKIGSITSGLLKKEVTRSNVLDADTATKDTVEKGVHAIKEAIRDAQKTIVEAKTPTPMPQLPAKIDLTNQFAPLAERLEAVQSELRTIREARLKTPPPAQSLGAELALAEGNPQQSKPSYAQMARKPRAPRPNHTLIVSATDPQKTGDQVLETIRVTLDRKKSGAKVDRIRKARNHKVILSCNTKEDLAAIQKDTHGCKEIRVEKAKARNPLARVKDVLAYHTDDEIVDCIKRQNDHLLRGIEGEQMLIKIRYRKRARNPLECHPVLELSPEVHKRLLEAGHIHIGLQRRPIVDQSPLVQCTKCLGFGHTRAVCKGENFLCSHCGDPHKWEECPQKARGIAPSCKNCRMAENNEAKDHNAFSEACPEKQKWDSIARSKISYLC